MFPCASGPVVVQPALLHLVVVMFRKLHFLPRFLFAYSAVSREELTFIVRAKLTWLESLKLSETMQELRVLLVLEDVEDVEDVSSSSSSIAVAGSGNMSFASSLKTATEAPEVDMSSPREIEGASDAFIPDGTGSITEPFPFVERLELDRVPMFMVVTTSLSVTMSSSSSAMLPARASTAFRMFALSWSSTVARVSSPEEATVLIVLAILVLRALVAFLITSCSSKVAFPADVSMVMTLWSEVSVPDTSLTSRAVSPLVVPFVELSVEMILSSPADSTDLRLARSLVFIADIF